LPASAIALGVVSHVEFLHELAGYTAFLRRLSSFFPAQRYARVVEEAGADEAIE
jgi:hypothetical protein